MSIRNGEGNGEEKKEKNKLKNFVQLLNDSDKFFKIFQF